MGVSGDNRTPWTPSPSDTALNKGIAIFSGYISQTTTRNIETILIRYIKFEFFFNYFKRSWNFYETSFSFGTKLAFSFVVFCFRHKRSNESDEIIVILLSSRVLSSRLVLEYTTIEVDNILQSQTVGPARSANVRRRPRTTCLVETATINGRHLRGNRRTL